MFVMKTAYKDRAYPSKEQKAKLDRQMFLAKNLYNSFLKNQKRIAKKQENACRIQNKHMTYTDKEKEAELQTYLQ
ncbi:MAG: helix-turn-helix domain-containing protein [Candidatus Micrarchaeaceae archaeon]